MPAKPKKGATTAWIGAAQCAALTGLSARALRVYEQQKLLKPVRDANGWRQYSAADLTRLNTIAVLKGGLVHRNYAPTEREITCSLAL